MVFIETPIFTGLIQELISDDTYRELQQTLIFRPEAGNVISGSGGLRKIRWRVPGTGKQGGLRVIYYWDAPRDIIYMLLVYRKSRQEDLTPEQARILRNLVREWLNEER